MAALSVGDITGNQPTQIKKTLCHKFCKLQTDWRLERSFLGSLESRLRRDEHVGSLPELSLGREQDLAEGEAQL